MSFLRIIHAPSSCILSSSNRIIECTCYCGLLHNGSHTMLLIAWLWPKLQRRRLRLDSQFSNSFSGSLFSLCVSNAPREGKKGDPYNVLTSAIILGSYFQEICLDEVLNVQLQTEKVSSRHFLLQMKRVTFKLHDLGVKPRGIFKTWQRSLKRRIFTGSLMDIDKIFKDLQTFFTST